VKLRYCYILLNLLKWS